MWSGRSSRRAPRTSGPRPDVSSARSCCGHEAIPPGSPASPPIGVAHAILRQHAAERVLHVDLLLVGECEQDEEDVAQLEREVLLRLACLLRLVAVPVVQLARQLARLLDEAGQV